MLIRTIFYFNLLKMFQKNQQLNNLFDQVKIQQLFCLDVAQSYLINLLKTINQLKLNYSNLFDLVNTAVISQLIFINNKFFKKMLLIELTIKYFTPFVISFILHVVNVLAASARAVHFKTYQCIIQLKQMYRVRADELIIHKFKTKF